MLVYLVLTEWLVFLQSLIIAMFYFFQGLFSLAFIIENNYSVDGVYFESKQSQIRGNLTLARILYEK